MLDERSTRRRGGEAREALSNQREEGRARKWGDEQEEEEEGARNALSHCGEYLYEFIERCTSQEAS